MSNLYYIPGTKHLHNDIQLKLAQVDNPQIKYYPVTIAPQPEYDHETQTLSGIYPPSEDPENPGHYIVHWKVEEYLQFLLNTRREEIDRTLDRYMNELFTLNLGEDDVEPAGYNEATGEVVPTKELWFEFRTTPEFEAKLNAAMATRSETVAIMAINGWFDLTKTQIQIILDAIAAQHKGLEEWFMETLRRLYQCKTISEVQNFMIDQEEAA